MTGRLLDLGDPGWGAALRRTRHDVYHLPDYVAVAASVVGGIPVAYRYTSPTGEVVLPLVLRPVPGSDRSDAVSPYGYSGPAGNVPGSDVGFWRGVFDDLVAVLREAGVVSAFVRLHPLLDAPEAVLRETGTLVDHGQTVSVDLTRTEDDLWRGTRRDHRYGISRARREGVLSRWNDWDGLEEWVSIYYENMEKVGATASYFFDMQYFCDLRDALGPRIHLAVATRDHEMIAGHLVLEHAGIVQTHLSGMRTEHRKAHPDKLLYHETRRWARERGNCVHHLGGGYGGAEDGLFAYKAGFAGGRHPFRSWRLVTDEAAYDRLTPPAASDRSAFFPGYRAPREETR